MPDSPHTAAERAHALIHAARSLLAHLERGAALSADLLRDAMTAPFGATDATGRWSWRDAYEASEAALILFLQRYAKPMRSRASTPIEMVALLDRLAALEPSHTRRSEEQLSKQQFSTPLALAYAVLRAARLRTADVVLEPSAGTGMLAVFPHTLGVPVHLNEFSDTRSALLRHLFPRAHHSSHNAEHIRDLLPDLHPSVVLMNPPFSRGAHIATRQLGTDLVHVASAYTALPPGGRLVAITSYASAPGTNAWHQAFAGVSPPPQVAFTTTIDGQLYQRRGTTFSTRLTVLDHTDQPNHHTFPDTLNATTSAELVASIEAHVPQRCLTQPVALDLFNLPRPTAAPRKRIASPSREPIPAPDFGPAADLVYQPINHDDTLGNRPIDNETFDPWRPECIRVDNAIPHPSALVQSSAMASIRPPVPSAQPKLPTAVISSGILSDAQLEYVVLAAEAHSRHLATEYLISDEWDDADPIAPGSHPGCVRFRRGYMIGDGTGTGKGRQAAALLLDSWLRGRRRLLWLSYSGALIKDARRDWTALGGDPRQLVELSKIRQGDAIPQAEAIVFATYSTLRSAARGDKPSRLHQLTTWLTGSLEPHARAAYDGLIVFDESHALGHAVATKGSRGINAPSQQGLAAMRLQHGLPDARVLYVSATGASSLEGFSYATRLGLWGSQDSAFDSRSKFIASMTAGGVAAMEVVARDAKSLGLYGSRSLSYQGVEVDILEHTLTDAQRAIYDAYAEAFIVIHNNLEAALKISNITDATSTLNSQAKAAVRSAFESTKQRFFGHLLNGMKCPTLIPSIQDKLDCGHCAIVQIISTGEALLNRRIAEIPVSEWDDLSIDLTPREYVLSYLENAFPTHLYEPYTDSEGHKRSRLIHDDEGHPVHSQTLLEARDRLIEHLASLPPVPTALDQILHTFGDEQVAEITGRSRRVLRIKGRLALRSRSASANLTDANAFQNDEKRILVFSTAGGTGRSYHADLGCKNQRLRVHYLLEPGWRADIAIQGLGRSHRTYQAQPPRFVPVTTDVRGERRFISTIARRLDALGALTRGQRDAQSAGMFRAEDNLESPYAHAALRQLFRAIHAQRIPQWSLDNLQSLTGLSLTHEGELKDQLPPMSQFLNRLLALRIDDQNSLFEELETRIEANIAQAREAGTYNVGVETLVADRFEIIERETVYTHPDTAAHTQLLKILRRDPIRPLPTDRAIAKLSSARRRRKRPSYLAINERSGRAGIVLPAPWRVLEDGGVEPRVAIIHPNSIDRLDASRLDASFWREAPEPAWRNAWDADIAALPTHKETTFWIVTGLLLPIWTMLPPGDMQIRRLTTDTGERLLGPLLQDDEAYAFRRTLGLGLPQLNAEEVKSTLLEHGTCFSLVNGWRLTRRLVMGLHRIELEGPVGDDVPAAKSLGCHTEIISFRTRVFIDRDDPSVLAAVLDRWPLDTERDDAA